MSTHMPAPAPGVTQMLAFFMASGPASPETPWPASFLSRHTLEFWLKN